MIKKFFTNTSLIILGVLLVTILALFIMFAPENPSWLYYFNMTVSVVLSFLYAGLFSYPKTKNTSVIFQVACWSYICFYIVFAVVGMIVYSAIVDPVTDAVLSEDAPEKVTFMKVYISMFIVVTALWIVSLVLIHRVDKSNTIDTNQVRMQSFDKKAIADKLLISANKYRTTRKNNGLDYDDTYKKISRLSEEIKYLLPKAMSLDGVASSLMDIEDGLSVLVNKMNSADLESLASIELEIKSNLEDGMNEIKQIQTLSRR